MFGAACEAALFKFGAQRSARLPLVARPASPITCAFGVLLPLVGSLALPFGLAGPSVVAGLGFGPVSTVFRLRWPFFGRRICESRFWLSRSPPGGARRLRRTF